jgi:hypothetical protein
MPCTNGLAVHHPRKWLPSSFLGCQSLTKTLAILHQEKTNEAGKYSAFQARPHIEFNSAESWSTCPQERLRVRCHQKYSLKLRTLFGTKKITFSFLSLNVFCYLVFDVGFFHFRVPTIVVLLKVLLDFFFRRNWILRFSVAVT